ncbi:MULTISPECIES: Imm30 family immunity protein [Bacillaceae]|uniref:Immunity protein 30 domain-containing protein n=1 Tax=Gottfriedia luciferensis TaxID=178774 RepID=A0ABX2ZU84_9BACI|nr:MULTISPECIES: Imm30 family immunity protein [Bacillaceae]ODG93365.1 hypothetical protein BED47_03490 [Gottfriedia luciferensis]
MNIDQEIIKLKSSRLLKSEQEVNDFEEAIERIVAYGEITFIKYLCYGFHDKTERDEVTFGLIHAIESFDQKYPLDDTLRELAKSVYVMIPDAMEWAKTLHKRILNHRPTLQVYIEVVKSLDTNSKNIIANIVSSIKDKNPTRFEEKGEMFLSSIN